MPSRHDPAVKAYLSERGRRAGQAGTGESKRRSPEHYRRLARMRRESARLRKWAAKHGGETHALNSLKRKPKT